MSKDEFGNYQPIYATAFQNANLKSDGELNRLVSQAEEYVAHVADVKRRLGKLHTALKKACK